MRLRDDSPLIAAAASASASGRYCSYGSKGSIVLLLLPITPTATKPLNLDEAPRPMSSKSRVRVQGLGFRAWPKALKPKRGRPCESSSVES